MTTPAPRPFISAAEAEVLTRTLPARLTDDMGELALYMYEALALADERAGCAAPAGEWLEQLQSWANIVWMQLQHVADNVGGRNLYIARGLSAQMSARDEEMCREFQRGADYRTLSQNFRLTVMRVRQITNKWTQREFERRQGRLPLGE